MPRSLCRAYQSPPISQSNSYAALHRFGPSHRAISDRAQLAGDSTMLTRETGSTRTIPDANAHQGRRRLRALWRRISPLALALTVFAVLTVVAIDLQSGVAPARGAHRRPAPRARFRRRHRARSAFSRPHAALEAARDTVARHRCSMCALQVLYRCVRGSVSNSYAAIRMFPASGAVRRARFSMPDGPVKPAMQH